MHAEEIWSDVRNMCWAADRPGTGGGGLWVKSEMKSTNNDMDGRTPLIVYQTVLRSERPGQARPLCRRSR